MKAFALSPCQGFYLALLGLTFGCGKPVAPVVKASSDTVSEVSVTTTKAKELSVPRTLSLSGSLTAAEEADVAAGAAGKVLATYVERGAVVKRGALLAKLDARIVDAQAKEAAAQLESLRLQAAQSQVDCQRTEQMFQKGAISKADYDRTHTLCATSKFTVSAAEARKNLTTEVLRDSEIRAPFSGMVVERFVSAGEYVRPDSRIVTLIAVDSLRVEITVPEADVTLVNTGMLIDFKVAAGDNSRTYQGRVRYVGPAVRKQTRDAIVEAVVDNAGHDLRPGMFVAAKLALGQQTLAAVPTSSVKSDGALSHVFVVANGRIEDRVVQTAEVSGDWTPIVSGLSANDEIVVNPGPDVRDGAKVK